MACPRSKWEEPETVALTHYPEHLVLEVDVVQHQIGKLRATAAGVK
jgi:hypothetical protein